MLQFIAQYWLTTLFGGACTVLVWLCRKFWKLYQSEKNHQKTDEQKAFYQGLQDAIKEGDKRLQDQIDVLQRGILSIQGKNFKQTCRDLLREGHEITIEEFAAITKEHDVYKDLGGNHDGDTLFELVSVKARNNLID